jgi:tRNA(His) guanylyltransferase
MIIGIIITTIIICCLTFAYFFRMKTISNKSKINFESLEKKYEENLDKTKITVFRLDGHKFSKFTSNFTKPFDNNFTMSMKQTALKTFEYFDFSIGFVGSDEITLCIVPKIGKNGEICDMEFSGRIQKMTTLLAGFVSVTFYKEFEKFYPMEKYTPHFDCRVYQVDSIDELLVNISERVSFTLRNSRMMFAQYHMTSKRVLKEKLTSEEAVELVYLEKKINFYETTNPDIRLGTIITTKSVEHEKNIIVKGETRVIKYAKNITQEQNLSPKQVMNLIF